MTHAEQLPLLGQVLRTARRNQGLSQQQLAELADVSRASVARIEAGVDISTLRFLRIATALHLEVALLEIE